MLRLSVSDRRVTSRGTCSLLVSHYQRDGQGLVVTRNPRLIRDSSGEAGDVTVFLGEDTWAPCKITPDGSASQPALLSKLRRLCLRRLSARKTCHATASSFLPTCYPGRPEEITTSSRVRETEEREAQPPTAELSRKPSPRGQQRKVHLFAARQGATHPHPFGSGVYLGGSWASSLCSM